MSNYKTDIINRICYTELVYARINKKLNKTYSNQVIEKMILDIIKETSESQFQKKGKNIYVINLERNIKLTINSNTYRIITANKIRKD